MTNLLLVEHVVSKHPPTLALAFTTYVRPLLDYATCVLSPHSVGRVKKSSPCNVALLSDYVASI